MKVKKPIPHEFVLELLERAAPYTKPMFGCRAVYVEDKIVLILRERGDPVEDDGVWLATTGEHHESLQKEFPSMRSLKLFGPGPTGWQVLPQDSSDFESSVEKACRLILAGDPRIGKIPKRKSPKKKSKTKILSKPAGRRRSRS